MRFEMLDLLILLTYDINITEAAGIRRLRCVAKQYMELKHLLLKEIDKEKDSLCFNSLVNNYNGKVVHSDVRHVLQVDEHMVLCRTVSCANPKYT